MATPVLGDGGTRVSPGDPPTSSSAAPLWAPQGWERGVSSLSAAPRASERGCSCGRPSRSPCLVPLCFLSRSVSFSSELVTQLVTHWERTETLNETGYRPSICKDGESWKKAAEGRARFWTGGRNEGRAERGRGAAGGRSCGNPGRAGHLPRPCRSLGVGAGGGPPTGQAWGQQGTRSPPSSSWHE